MAVAQANPDSSLTRHAASKGDCPSEFSCCRILPTSQSEMAEEADVASSKREGEEEELEGFCPEAV